MEWSFYRDCHGRSQRRHRRYGNSHHRSQAMRHFASLSKESLESAFNVFSIRRTGHEVHDVRDRNWLLYYDLAASSDENVIRQQRVGCAQWRLAAFGKRNFTDRFPAMNPKGRRSRRDPKLNFASWESRRSGVFKVTVLARLYARDPDDIRVGHLRHFAMRFSVNDA